MTKGCVSKGMIQDLSLSFWAAHTLALKSVGFRPTKASISSVIGVSRLARARFCARVKCETATSGGLSPSVANESLV